MILIFVSNASRARAQDPDAGVLYHPSQILVAFQPATVAAAKDAAHAAAQAVRVVREYHIVQGLQLVEIPEGQVQQALAAYRNNPTVLYAEPIVLLWGDLRLLGKLMSGIDARIMQCLARCPKVAESAARDHLQFPQHRMNTES